MELKIEELTKKYAGKTAIDHLSCTLTPGIIGLLGANGVGKSGERCKEESQSLFRRNET